MNDETTTQEKSKQEAIPVPVLDVDAYRADWTDLELTPEQEKELLLILWDMMRTLCDLNLEMDAVQMIMPPSLYKAFNDETDENLNEAEQQLDQNTDIQTSTRSKPNG
ncbi:hypothetical protein C8R30_10924 [Nitrosomonas nitrosa]|uniref:hypothetical protein n=1 Tax=Nitrosomonas nitrosa TaxID=52442 RepID=UPI000D307FD4|nr:hypothetical protein [Nitrosomonas nitrosa]PTQ98747.1 hypothetical protein C8R30_10924 [Nitrosomonas nitrosa]